MFRPTCRIRWKRDVEIEVTTNWSQDTGLSMSHTETRSGGQEEDVWYEDYPGESEVQMHLEEVSSYYDQSWGRMICAVSPAWFDVVHVY